MVIHERYTLESDAAGMSECVVFVGNLKGLGSAQRRSMAPICANNIGRTRCRRKREVTRQHHEGSLPARFTLGAQHQVWESANWVVLEFNVVELLKEARPEIACPRILKHVAGDHSTCLERLVLKDVNPLLGREPVRLQKSSPMQIESNHLRQIRVNVQARPDSIDGCHPGAAHPEDRLLKDVELSIAYLGRDDSVHQRWPEKEPALTPPHVLRKTRTEVKDCRLTRKE